MRSFGNDRRKVYVNDPNYGSSNSFGNLNFCECSKNAPGPIGLKQTKQLLLVPFSDAATGIVMWDGTNRHRRMMDCEIDM